MSEYMSANQELSRRGRIGVIVLSPNTTVEYEFQRMIPDGVMFYTARCFLPDVQDKQEKENLLLNIEEPLLQAAREVAGTQPDIILFACTIGSFLKGKNYDIEISDLIEKVTGIKSISTASAVLDALSTLKLRKITMVTPYHEEAGWKEKEFLENNLPSLRVVSMKHLGIIGVNEKGRLLPSSAYHTAKEAFDRASDGIFISCTNWRTMEIIRPLEENLKIPVVSSTQASLWACLKSINTNGTMDFGSIFVQ